MKEMRAESVFHPPWYHAAYEAEEEKKAFP